MTLSNLLTITKYIFQVLLHILSAFVKLATITERLQTSGCKLFDKFSLQKKEPNTEV